jgi:hypothetical protein
MRRLVAITAIALLMLSLASPLLAATCEHGKGMAACHRVQKSKPQKSHCEMMHQHDAAEQTDAAEDSGPTLQSAPSPQNCPMDCCQVGHCTNAVALAVAPSLPQPAVTEQTPAIVSVVFSSTGFSSHTDRGPPSA